MRVVDGEDLIEKLLRRSLGRRLDHLAPLNGNQSEKQGVEGEHHFVEEAETEVSRDLRTFQVCVRVETE